MSDTKNQNQRSWQFNRQINPVRKSAAGPVRGPKGKCSNGAGRPNTRCLISNGVNVSVLVQLVFLASLIVGSWVNLQRQLDLLQRDVTMLLQCHKDFTLKLETLSAKSISYEYRLRALEKQIPRADIAKGCLRP